MRRRPSYLAKMVMAGPQRELLFVNNIRKFADIQIIFVSLRSKLVDL